MKLWLKVLLTTAAFALILGLYVFGQIRSIKIEQITDDVHVLYGLGGNVAVLRTDEGTVIVDTMTLKLQGNLIRQKAEELTGKPVVMVINTHYHLDHTHGNPAFDAGIRIVSTERTLHHLKTTDSEFFSGAAAAMLPNETFSDARELKVGNKTIRLLHPGRGHTDGDLVALMVEDEVIHAGDLYFNRFYPNIDLEAGGSVQLWSDSIDKVLNLPFTRVIPGHGTASNRAGLQQFQAFIEQLASIGRAAAGEGWTMEHTAASSELTEDENYGEISLIVPIGLDREFVLQRAWEETTGNFTPRD